MLQRRRIRGHTVDKLSAVFKYVFKTLICELCKEIFTAKQTIIYHIEKIHTVSKYSLQDKL